MRYITFDEAGKTTGAYIQDVHPDHAARHVEATQAQLENWVNLRVVDGALEDAEPQTPPVRIPSSVTRRQARQALLLAGLLDNVQPALDAIPDATQRRLMQIEWDDSQEFHRNRPALLALAGALGLNSSQIDQLFITAAGL